MATLIPLNILIGDRTYRIKVLPGDEEAVRSTLKTINEKILEFRSQYSGKDMQDYISMVLIWYATLPANFKDEEMVNQKDVQKLLEKMESQINGFLQS